MTGTELYREMLAFDHGDQERSELMEKVWRHTPWMANVFTGSIGEGRYNEIRDWCTEHFGREAWPIHGKPGAWHFGGATIHGWTWIGFEREEMLQRFLDAWPAPPTVETEAA